MLVQDNTILRICGTSNGASSRLVCLDYDAAGRTFIESPLMLSSDEFGPLNRFNAAVSELSPGNYWVTGGTLATASMEPTASTYIFKDGEIVSAGPNLPLALHSHCLVRLNLTHFFLHGGKTDGSPDDGTDAAFLYDIRTREFADVTPSPHTFHKHVCGVTRDGPVKILAVGGGTDRREVDIFDPATSSWTEMGPFDDGVQVHEEVIGWQMEDTFQVLGLEDGTIVYEFDTADQRFIRIDRATLPQAIDQSSALLPIPSYYLDECYPSKF